VAPAGESINLILGSRSYLTGDGAVHGEQTKMAVELAIDKGATERTCTRYSVPSISRVLRG
jgi:hypothetical protein